MSTRKSYYTERRRKRRMRKIINRVILILVLFCILTVGIFVASFFSTRFEYETVISGIDCSFLTVEEATEKINAEIKDKTFLITVLYKTETGDISIKKYALSSKKLNMELKTDLRELFYQEKQSGNRDFEAQFDFDENELENYLLTVSELQEENFVQPQNAYLELTEDGIALEKEVYGLEIDTNSAYNYILSELQKGNFDIDITVFFETEPDIFSTDETLIENQTKINQSLNTKITFIYSDNTEEVLDKSTIITWLYQDTDGLFYFDEAKIVEYVDNLAEVSLEKTSQIYFKATDLENREFTFSLSEALAPQIDKESELSFIKEAINTGGEYVSSFQYDKEIDTIDSYVELDITRQKVWLYVDKNCILETDCVTGNVSRGYYTPTGLYFLTYKTRGATLKGEGYASYVEYWMPFNGNIGFHDASWRSSFGGNIYLTNGSHGCVNLPVEAAKTLYEYINESMPIFVYAS